ncbi:MAG: chromosome segregation protein SMC [Acidimicrobiales bacterium]
MHLKSLTLRGFKSFADPTTLEFEPGVTVVVGPNGSGKSNVVDAVAWALGAQGPRVVRSSKMDDVIFAGTSKRPALGRAEVTLTIDNSSRRLPIDLAEVTITRTLFRTGESEYSMNGAPCRLLDVQEMLSDAGVGRQQHVIMSQGQLAGVLDARPEDRRAVIEEAAGVLKFRRRRERAERRLESTEANLLRLQDLLREVRRQLRPLERQAEAARRYGSLVNELQALRLYVAGRELDSLQRRTDENEQRRTVFAGDEERLRAGLARLDELVDTSEAALTTEQQSEVIAALSRAERLHERARGVANVIAERRRRVEEALMATTETDVVSSLEAESARLERDLVATAEAVSRLEPEWAELERRSEELRLAEEQSGDRPDEARKGAIHGSAELRRARDGVQSQLSRARETLARSNERAAAIERQLAELGGRGEALAREAAQRSESLAALREAQVAAERDERAAADAVTVTETVAREAVERAQGLHARAEALRGALDEAHARAGVEQLAGRPGVLGTLLDIVEVDEGCERAFEAAVQEALAAVVVDGPGEARSAVEHLHELGLSGAVLPVDTGRASSAARPPENALRSRVRGTRPGAEALLDGLLADVVLCSTGIRDALDLAGRCSAGTVVVTTEGDRLSARGWRLGAGRAGATRAALESVQADASQADDVAAEARSRAEGARQSWSSARRSAADATASAAAAGAEVRQAVAQRDETARRLAELSSEAEQVDAGQAQAASLADRLGAELAEREAELLAAEDEEVEARAAETAVAHARRRLDEQARELASLRSDLEVRSAGIDERHSLLTERRADVERRLAGFEAAREGAAGRRRMHEAASRALVRIGSVVGALLEELGAVLAALREERRRHDEAVAGIAAHLASARVERATTERDLAALREQAQRNDLERAELRVRLETALEAIRHDLDVEIADALAAECPELPPGTPPTARVRELERELRLLGPINPLALEELAGLEERDRFLSGQLEDVRNTRRELGRVIKAVDQEIVAVFSEAFSDVASHFEHLFETLFPGGTGRLTLLDPEDLLSSGIEIDARPAGRNVRRLSLLSGGERSLVALAFLFAVFRSRPSPFYLMDEVEAALDDVNLHRFLDLVDEFRTEAQLVIVSHQKRTMESADVIYGVTMQPGGASKVVCERLRGETAATA